MITGDQDLTAAYNAMELRLDNSVPQDAEYIVIGCKEDANVEIQVTFSITQNNVEYKLVRPLSEVTTEFLEITPITFETENKEGEFKLNSLKDSPFVITGDA